MKHWLRRYLGIADLRADSAELKSRARSARDTLNDAILATYKCRDEIKVLQVTLGILVARLDPHRTTAEDTPEKQARSKELGETVIKRLEAEAKARKHTEGTL